MTFPVSLPCLELTADFASATLELCTWVSCRLHGFIPGITNSSLGQPRWIYHPTEAKLPATEKSSGFGMNCCFTTDYWMYYGGAPSCDSLTELLVGQMELFLGSVQIFCPLSLHLPPLDFCLQPDSVSMHWNTSRGFPPSFYFGLISMHLFHSSHLLLFCVLESIQGEELIDLGSYESTAWSCF